MDSDLDTIERKAQDMIRFYQEECQKQCAPFVEIICQVQSLRPRTYQADGQTFVPFHPAATADKTLPHGQKG